MKQKLLLITLLCCGFLYSTVKANETEPNDTKAQANTLALNGSNSGKINTAGDQDWWKITTTGDGKLDITLTPLSGKYTWIFLYDNDGTTQLNATYATSTFTVSTDGLAAGTYYVKVVTYYAADTSSYTISNHLTIPSQVNDAEPDNSKAQALTLQQNGSKTGHVGYYYNHHRDTADWYKITTNGDGFLSLSLTPANGKYVWIYLFDHDGTTLINSGYSTNTFNVNTDGLAAGTYYIKIICYYSNSDFAPYKLSNTLTKPSDANDTEPNDTKATAKTLILDDSTTGHTGYYYNNHRDSADWYKLTTNKDGYLRLSLTPENGEYVWIYLFDRDGTTLINSTYSTSAFNLYTDGLAAGTYYVRINCYYNTKFAPYKLSDSLFTYSYTADDDAEPNETASQAQTLLANKENDGHTGFYYNHARDSVDWWKINYTGNGPLTVTMDLEGNKCCGIQYTWMYIYKDTLSSPIYSSYTSASQLVANLSSLTQGYYWVRVNTYYNSKFMSYSLTSTFTQNRKAGLKVIYYDTIASCSNTIKLQPNNGNGPFTVQLYRFGIKYGNAVSVKKGSNAKFENLPAGSYYGTAYADGATGNAFGKSKTIILEPVPTGLQTTAITKSSAKLNWALVDCADYYKVKYRKHGTTTWTSKKTVGNVNLLKITGLKANTTYEWEVATVDSANGAEATSAFTDSVLFTTSASLIADVNNGNSEEDLSINKNNLQSAALAVSPNPATNYFVIHFNTNSQTKVNASVYSAEGRAVWTSGLINANALNGKQVNVSQFAKGVFYLKIINEQGELIGSAKIVITK
jgi:predicted secreted protein